MSIPSTPDSPNRARNSKIRASQHLFDEALTLIKQDEQHDAATAGSATAVFTRVHSLLQQSHTLAIEVYGRDDLRVARIGYQLGSFLLTHGRLAEADQIMAEVMRVRASLLSETSDEMYDVYADMSYIQLEKAQLQQQQNGQLRRTTPAVIAVATAASSASPSSSAPPTTSHYDLALSYAQRARDLVSLHANSSTTERYHYRLCLISSRLARIVRAQAMLKIQSKPSTASQQSSTTSSQLLSTSLSHYTSSYASALKLPLDLTNKKNVKLYIHSCMELAEMQVWMKQWRGKMKLKRDDAGGDDDSAVTKTLDQTSADYQPAELYSRAIRTLISHGLTELPFMAHAQAGLGLLLMEEADTMDQEMRRQEEITVSDIADRTSQVSSTSSSSSTQSEIRDLLTQAISLTQEALKAYQSHQGEISSDVATMCYNLGSLHYRLHSYSDARSYLSRSLSIRTKLLGKKHSSVVKVQEDLKRLEVECGVKQTNTTTAPVMNKRSSNGKNPPVSKRVPTPPTFKRMPTAAKRGTTSPAPLPNTSAQPHQPPLPRKRSAATPEKLKVTMKPAAPTRAAATKPPLAPPLRSPLPLQLAAKEESPSVSLPPITNVTATTASSASSPMPMPSSTQQHAASVSLPTSPTPPSLSSTSTTITSSTSRPLSTSSTRIILRRSVDSISLLPQPTQPLQPPPLVIPPSERAQTANSPKKVLIIQRSTSKPLLQQSTQSSSSSSNRITIRPMSAAGLTVSSVKSFADSSSHDSAMSTLPQTRPKSVSIVLRRFQPVQPAPEASSSKVEEECKQSYQVAPAKFEKMEVSNIEQATPDERFVFF